MKQVRADEAASRADAAPEEEEEEDEGDLTGAMTVNGAEQVDEDQELGKVVRWHCMVVKPSRQPLM